MNKTVKNWLLAATVMIIIGILIIGGMLLYTSAMALSFWDYTKLGVKYSTEVYGVAGDFNNISIDTNIAAVELRQSEDGKCRVECYEDEKVRHIIDDRDDTLTITTEDDRKWYDFIYISLSSPKITVYLPKDEYEILDISSSTGAVYIPKSFTFESITIEGDTGAVNCSASVKGSVDIELDTGALTISDVSTGSMRLKTDTGSIKLGSAAVAGNIDVKATTGYISLENITCKDMKAEADTGRVELVNVTCAGLHSETDTGDIALKNVVGSGKFELIRDTGDIFLDGCDAAELYIDTDTGDVTGELLTDKIFFAGSDTGHVSVPKSMTGGRCEIITDTGSVDVGVRG